MNRKSTPYGKYVDAWGTWTAERLWLYGRYQGIKLHDEQYANIVFFRMDSLHRPYWELVYGGVKPSLAVLKQVHVRVQERINAQAS